MVNVEQDKLAPGQYGQVTFYVRPSHIGIEYCDVIPQVWISQSEVEGPYEWYPGADAGLSLTEAEVMDLEALYQMVEEHIQFFADAEMATPITSEGMRVLWNENDKEEKAITIYWKWHYEYPFAEYTEDEFAELSEEQKTELIDQYDMEDTQIGNNVTAMKFHFTFVAQ